MDKAALQVQTFNDAIAERSGKAEVDDFVLKNLYQIQWSDMLQPAPMAVAILGQLTLVATAADFKLVGPTGGFEHVKYPDSFRATIAQLVNTGAVALNQSYSNFDKINKECAGVKLGVNNIIELLTGVNDTPQENDAAVKRYLPGKIKQLQKAVNACLIRAKETDDTFNDLLKLTMEIHESCTNTQSDNEAKVKDADLRQKILAEQMRAAEENKKLSAETVDRLRTDFNDSRKQFDKAAKSMPTAFGLVGIQLLDSLARTSSAAIETVLKSTLLVFLGSNAFQSEAVNYAFGGTTVYATNSTENAKSIVPADIDDPGYQKADQILLHSQGLESLVRGQSGTVQWDRVAGGDRSSCGWIRQELQIVVDQLENRTSKTRGNAAARAIELAKKGVELSQALEDAAPMQNKTTVDRLVKQIPEWADDVLLFSSRASMILNTNTVSNNSFVTPDQNPASSGGVADLVVKNAQYRLSVAEAQLNTSREGMKVVTNKMLEVTTALGEIMGQIAGLNVQKIEWDKIRQILIRAISFLCQLKAQLNNLVHFFDNINNLVSVSLQESATNFIQIIQEASTPIPGTTVGGITLDNFARQEIYTQAISAAKVSALIEYISDVYVNLYGHRCDNLECNKRDDIHTEAKRHGIHTGVNMLLGMGGIVGSGDEQKIADAGTQIQSWAEGASKNIRQQVQQRMNDVEDNISLRISELRKSIDGILPPPSVRIKQIVDDAKEERVKYITERISEAAATNPLYDNPPKAKKRNLMV